TGRAAGPSWLPHPRRGADIISRQNFRQPQQIGRRLRELHGFFGSGALRERRPSGPVPLGGPAPFGSRDLREPRKPLGRRREEGARRTLHRTMLPLAGTAGLAAAAALAAGCASLSSSAPSLAPAPSSAVASSPSAAAPASPTSSAAPTSAGSAAASSSPAASS